MVKIYSLILCIFLIGNLGAQAPVMNPIAGDSLVCTPPASAPIYTASASNSPTSYSWTVFPSAGVVIGSPSSATTTINYPTPNGSYTVVCYATNGSGTSSPVKFVVSVFETPNVTFSGATSFCQGSSTNISASSTMLSASSTIFYSWWPPTGLNTTVGQFVSASPTTVTNYTLTAINGGCVGTNTITITPLPSPTLNVSVTNTAVCYGDPTTITVTGALSYTFSPAISNGVSFPVYQSFYSFTGSNGIGCSTTTSTIIIINPAPFFSVSAYPPSACMGQSVAISFSGTSTSYSFNSVPCGTLVVVSPTATTAYTISGVTSQGCKGNFYFTEPIGCIGINGLVYNEPLGLNAYPNPNAGTFNLSSGENELVKIVNELGQLIKTIELKAEEKISISDLSPGIYFVMSADTRIKIIVLE